MFNIAIFEPNISDNELLQQFIFSELFEKFEFKIFSFVDEGKFIDFIYENNVCLLIVDVNMVVNSGMKSLNTVKSFKNPYDLIVISEDKDMALYGYKYNAFDFILKPINYIEISESLRRLIKTRDENSQSFYIKNGCYLERFCIDEIYYFSSLARKVSLVNANDSIDFYGKLDDVMLQLPKNFIRVHQSYIVNNRYLKAISKNELILTNGEIIPVSKKYAEILKKYF
ncbi:MAG: LytR/AlgR family response regulator transcription factor [Candidatus Gastranaerophilaceae bacterium]